MRRIVFFCFAAVMWLSLGATVQATSYTDVSYKYWAYQDIQFLSKHEVISGYTDGKFRPGATITRKDAAMMMTRALDLVEPVEAPEDLTDMTPNSPGYPQVAIALHEGWFTLNDGAFQPDKPLNRADMARALAVAFSYEGQGISKFSDVDEKHPAYPYIDAIAFHDVTTGYMDQTFRPEEIVTRAQFSAFVSRVFQKPIAYEVKSGGETVHSVPSIDEALEKVAQYADGTIHPASNRLMEFSQEIAADDRTGIESGVLIYNGVGEKTHFSKGFFRPYLQATTENHQSVDLFDTFIILGLRYDGGWLADTSLNRANYADWQAYIDRTFAETGALNQLNEAAMEADRTVDVYVSIPYPKHGEPFISLDGREVYNDLYARYDIVSWYVKNVAERIKREDYSNLNFKGFYWLSETVKYQEDEVLLSSIAQYIHRNDLLFIYAPHATSTNFHKWKAYGFDAAFLQPNSFRANLGNKEERLHRAFVNAQIYGAGITMEIDSYGPAQVELGLGVEAFDLYNDFAKRYGLDEKGMIFYQGVNMVERMATYSHPTYRMWYNQLIDTFFDPVRE